MCSSIRYLKMARKLALQSRERHRHGAVLVKGGRVISTGFNFNKKINYLSRKYFSSWPTTHAEMHCLLGMHPDDVKGCVMYVYRVKRRGEVGFSAPCERCARAIADFKIKRVVYSTEEYPFFASKEIF